MSPRIAELPQWAQDWARLRLEQHGRTGLEVGLEQWRGLRDWLASLPRERPKMVAKLHKLTMDGALVAQAKWHTEMADRTRRARELRQGFGGDPDAIEVVLDLSQGPDTTPQSVVAAAMGQGWHWVRVTSPEGLDYEGAPEGLDYEGAAMGHCVGGGGYDEGCTIYSLRDPENSMKQLVSCGPIVPSNTMRLGAPSSRSRAGPTKSWLHAIIRQWLHSLIR